VTPEAVFLIVEEIAARNLTIKAYCEQRGIKATTMNSRASRAGVRIGVELRRRRVERVHALKAAQPQLSWTRAALTCGFDTLSRFQRSRRSLANWGVNVEAPHTPTAAERIATALYRAERLAGAVNLTLRGQLALRSLQPILADYRAAVAAIGAHPNGC